VGITIGVQPNIDFLKNTPIETNQGILVDKHLQTSVENIYAIGDCAEMRNPQAGRRAIEPVWYTGRMMGETVASTITGNPQEYNPGLWFNSAKFFDLEYQVYGFVPNGDMEDYKQYYWQHEKAEEAIRIVTNRNSEVVGINALGLRLNQQVCDHWLRNSLVLEEVIARLDEMNFNPEFTLRLSKQVKLQAV
jgi:NADPH-dependent 2,4-dienoyl-CoA reductase/sulfur reductase-like enzyme